MSTTLERELQDVEFKRSASPYAKGERAGIGVQRAAILRSRGVVSYVGKGGKKLSEDQAKQVDKQRAERDSAKKDKDRSEAAVDKMERGGKTVRK